MHILEATIRTNGGNIQRTLEFWKSLISLDGAFNKEGQALSRMDGENSVIIIRHAFESLAEEQEFSDGFKDSQCATKLSGEWNDYFEGLPTFYRYKVLHSY